MHEHDPLIGEYEHERLRHREAEALQMLRKIGSMVKPLMRQRGWKVDVLAEFWPDQKNLLGLNWNRGQKICLRLRHAGDERQFMPIDNVVDTMLHELSHIVHGPHDEAFHALWDQLRDEYEGLLRKGYTGEGFLSTGHRLGGGQIPMNEARRRARAAAEKRRVLTAGSGQKVGGRAVRRGEDIRSIIADAVERRANITRGCASGTERSRGIFEETSRNGFRTKAEEDDANERAIMQAYMELVQEEERERFGRSYVPSSQANPAGSRGKFASPGVAPPVPAATKPRIASRKVLPASTSTQGPPSDGWACRVCTLFNKPGFLCCDACGMERSSNPIVSGVSAPKRPSSVFTEREKPHSKLLRQDDRSKPRSSLTALASLHSAQAAKPLGWVCNRCGTFMENQWWTCSQCGTMKESSNA